MREFIDGFVRTAFHPVTLFMMLVIFGISWYNAYASPSDRNCRTNTVHQTK